MPNEPKPVSEIHFQLALFHVHSEIRALRLAIQSFVANPEQPVLTTENFNAKLGEWSKDQMEKILEGMENINPALAAQMQHEIDSVPVLDAKTPPPLKE